MNEAPFQIVRLGLGWVPQGRQIFPSLNVIENLLVGCNGRNGGWKLEDIYDFFPPLKERAYRAGRGDASADSGSIPESASHATACALVKQIASKVQGPKALELVIIDESFVTRLYLILSAS